MRAKRRRDVGFSLIELVMVLAVTLILTSLILPAMSQVRENVRRVICASNLRQIGFGVHMFVRNNGERLPESRMIEDPLEMMAVHFPEETTTDGWDGLGLLYSARYIDAPACFYCPSHTGEHTMDRYDWFRAEDEDQTIYCNYHYGGHRWVGGPLRRLDDPDLVIAADGFRRPSDFNHGTSMNTVLGDGSVQWLGDDRAARFFELCEAAAGGGDEAAGLWGELEDPVTED